MLGRTAGEVVGLDAGALLGPLPGFGEPFLRTLPFGRARGFPGPDGGCWLVLERAPAFPEASARFADSLPLAVLVWHLDDPGEPAGLRLVYANSASVTPELDWRTRIGHRIGDIVPSTVRSGRAAVYARVAEQGGTVALGRTELEAPMAGHIAIFASGLPDRHVVTVGSWETERVRIERDLRDSEDRFRVLFATMACGVAVLDGTMRALEVNLEWARILGYPPEELVGRRLTEFIVEDERDAHEARRARLRVGLSDGVQRRRVLHRSGRIALVEGTATPFVQDGQERFLAVIFDVTALWEAEEARRASDERFRLAFENAPIGIGVYEPDGRVRMVNRVLADLLGSPPEALVGAPLASLVAPDDLPLVEARLAQHRGGADHLPSARFHMRAADGGHLLVDGGSAPLRDSDGRITGFVMHAVDLTAQLRLEEQVRRAQRSEVIGRIAGGVAHDFNNALGIIRGSVDFLRRDDGSPKARAELLARVDAAASRAADLTRQLTMLGRRDYTTSTTSAPHGVLGDLRPVLVGALGEAITLRVDVAADTPAVRMARPHLEQVLLNLTMNAREAMPGGGTFTIAVRPVALGGDEEGAGGLVGDFVEWRVEDDGAGMRPDVAAVAFEPFFTTKALGKGTGLGLAIVQSLAARAGGHVHLRTEEGRGTTFLLYLPAAAPSVAVPAPVRSRTNAHGQTLLLCEDERYLLELFTLALRQAGYHVLAAADPQDALHLAEAHRIDALITDVVMPGMRGTVLAAEVRRRQPHAPVLFISGYSEEHIGAAADPVFGAFLPKPFVPSALVDAVNAMLG